ncbi:hypothetical protein V6Z11_D01G182800 [Gossypium hirsutum]
MLILFLFQLQKIIFPKRLEHQYVGDKKILPYPANDEDWKVYIFEKFVHLNSTNIQELKHIVLIHGVLYHKDTGRVLSLCVFKNEVGEKLKKNLEQQCGEKGLPLHRLLQRVRYFWPTMSNDMLQL